jgi:N-acetylglucosamine kinase
LAFHLLGRKISAHRLIFEKKAQPDLEKIWQIWCSVNAQLLHALILTIDPHIIVLGGGLSTIEGLIPALEKHLARLQWDGLPIPVIKKAARGETAAALGAAYQAWQGAQNV